MKADVIVIGHGLAGGLLTRHLLRQLPGLDIVVVDHAAPVDPQRSRLGESTTEAASWYLETVLGLGDHLVAAHVPKLGLRFFLPGDRYSHRAEFGIMRLGGTIGGDPAAGTRPRTWQIHRGRFDTHLRELNAPAVRWIEAGVTDVRTGPPHRVRLSTGEQISARWVVDASRTGVLTHALGPLRLLPHRFHASWAWVERVDPDDLCDSPQFLARTQADLRWRSTCHWMGARAWVWAIPHRDGTTSMGIVSDQPVPTDTPSWLAWFTEHEPELARLLRPVTPVTHATVNATAADEVLHPSGLARTGDAAGFLDPLYSSALDQTVLLNQLIVAAIAADDVPRQVRLGNLVHQQLSTQYHAVYSDLFSMLHHPRALAAKLMWDHLLYFHGLAPLLTCGHLTDPGFFTEHGALTRRLSLLQQAVQPRFRAWASTPPEPARGVIDIGSSPHLIAGLERLRTRQHHHDFGGAFRAGLDTLEQAAVCLHQQVATVQGRTPDPMLNPYDPTRPHQRRGVTGPLRDAMAPTWLHPA